MDINSAVVCLHFFFSVWYRPGNKNITGDTSLDNEAKQRPEKESDVGRRRFAAREFQKRRAAVRGKRRLISHRESGAEHANGSARLLTLQACLFVCVYSAQCLSACFLPRCKFSTNTITGAPDDRYE